MNNKINSLATPQALSDDTSKYMLIIQNALKNVRCTFEAEIIGIEDKNGCPYYKVRPLLKRITTTDQYKPSAEIPNVPAAILNYGNFALLGRYKLNAKVIVGVSDYDHTNIKYKWQTDVPASQAMHDIKSAVILYGLWATGEKFDNYIDVRNDGELKIVTTAKVNLETKEANIKANKAIVEADTVNVDSGDINLGKGVRSGVLTAGTLTLAASAVNVSGLGDATLTGELIIESTSGSKQVKAGA